jgi:hypothetical protein
MDGEWVETRMRKMIYGVVVPRVKHPIMAERQVSRHIPKVIWYI